MPEDTQSNKEYPSHYLMTLNDFNTRGKILVNGSFDKNMADWAGKQIKTSCESAEEHGLGYAMFVIDSQGGAVETLQRFVSYMEMFRPNPDFKFVGYVSVDAHSAAFELLQYCDWRIAHIGACLWPHYGKLVLANHDQALLYEGNKNALAYEKNRIQETVRAYSKRSGLSAKQVHQILKSDLPLTATQALELGFIDEIVDNIPDKSIKPDFTLKF